MTPSSTNRQRHGRNTVKFTDGKTPPAFLWGAIWVWRRASTFLQRLQLTINHGVTYGVTRARKLGEIPQRLDLCVYKGSNVVEGVGFCPTALLLTQKRVRLECTPVKCLKRLNGKHRRYRPQGLVRCAVWTWPISPPTPPSPPVLLLSCLLLRVG